MHVINVALIRQNTLHNIRNTILAFRSTINICMCLCSQVSNSQCRAAERPTLRRPCNTPSCDEASGNLTLVYGPWSVCNAACAGQSGASDRSANCVGVDGSLVGVDVCPSYSGASPISVQLSSCKTPCTVDSMGHSAQDICLDEGISDIHTDRCVLADGLQCQS